MLLQLRKNWVNTSLYAIDFLGDAAILPSLDKSGTLILVVMNDT